MREIVLDTETTGLDPNTGDRIVEIGALELINHLPSGKIYHQYINPERDMPAEAFAVHGLSEEFLSDKPVFRDVAEEFLQFVGKDPLIIHNASFDMKFLNFELSLVEKERLEFDRVIDTLLLARKKHPMGPNSLDALCKRYRIDNTMRELHGALLDSELLAGVYLELIGGRQTSLTLAQHEVKKEKTRVVRQTTSLKRTEPLPRRLTKQEIAAHNEIVAELGENALWHGYLQADDLT